MNYEIQIIEPETQELFFRCSHRRSGGIDGKKCRVNCRIKSLKENDFENGKLYLYGEGHASGD